MKIGNLLKSGTSETPAVSGGKKPTPEQSAILEALKNPFKVLVIEAGAGTGKTTTLRMIADVMKGRGQYTAFNSSLVDDSKSKFAGTKVSCNTTHSLGFQAVGRRFGHRLNSPRIRTEQVAAVLGIQKMSFMVGEIEKTLSAGFLAGQVLGAIKRFCQSADPEVNIQHFRYIDGIENPGGGTGDRNYEVRQYLIPFARTAWEDLSSEKGTLPFNHDHYVKVWQLGNPVIPSDYILLDESQDTAPVMLDIIAQQKAPVILVGDSAQQIYTWRGAVNAMAAFPDAERLFLSQSFRFGPAIAEVANAILACLSEPTQLVLKGLPSINSKVEPIETPDCVLCRTNAVAVSNLLAFLASGKKAFLVGGGSEVTSFVQAAADLKQGKGTSHQDLACFSSWQEVQEYSKLEEGEDLKLMVKLIDGFGTDVILNALKSMPDEKHADVTVCTAHKSKGREWGKVQLASDFPTKSKSGDEDLRLLYVAATRAKEVLDVSLCPFFTGQDALDLSEAIAKSKAQGTFPEAILETASEKPAFSKATTGKPGEFTWMRNDGVWAVRGPEAVIGSSVPVVRKDGSVQNKTLVRVIKRFGDVCVYEVS